MSETKKRTYVLYDSRAADGLGTDEATVLVVCESDQRAKSHKGGFGGMACYSYADDGKQLTDERHE